VTIDRDIPPSQISYWQMGCDDAKAGKPQRKLGAGLFAQRGYENGFYWGQHGKSKPVPVSTGDWFSSFATPESPLEIEPPLKNPYMETVESIEQILTRMNTFAKEFPQALPREKRDTYLVNLLRVRDELSALRLDEMADES
jgi:hypothetical protein